MSSSEMSHVHYDGGALCRRYGVAHFVPLSLSANVIDAACLHFKVLWAIGRLADGQSEFMGVWARSPDDEESWSTVLTDLGIRGVERIDHALTLGVACPTRHSLTRPRVQGWSRADTWPLMPSAGSARRWSHFDRAMTSARRAQGFLVRSTRSRGPFQSRQAVLAFVAERLERSSAVGPPAEHLSLS